MKRHTQSATAIKGLRAQAASKSFQLGSKLRHPLSYCGLTSYCVSAELLSMTTYVFTAYKHNLKCFTLTSVTETLTGKSWLRSQISCRERQLLEGIGITSTK